MEKPVVLATYRFLSDALVLRSRLEFEGIECFIPEENTVSILPFITAMTVRVLVNEKDLLEAQRLYRDVSDADGSSEPEVKTAEKKGQNDWPWNVWYFLIGLFGGIPMRRRKKK